MEGTEFGPTLFLKELCTRSNGDGSWAEECNSIGRGRLRRRRLQPGNFRNTLVKRIAKEAITRPLTISRGNLCIAYRSMYGILYMYSMEYIFTNNCLIDSLHHPVFTNKCLIDSLHHPFYSSLNNKQQTNLWNHW